MPRMEMIEYHRLAVSEDDVPDQIVTTKGGRRVNTFLALLGLVTFISCCLVALVLTIIFTGISPRLPPDASACGMDFPAPYRPQYHFTPMKNWMNDPNGLVYYHGEYELYYQYNPYGCNWGHMSWGHAKSIDMVHWVREPVAIPEANGVMIFSGSAIVDTNNTSGYGNKTSPPLLAFYTGYTQSTKIQDQRMAYSTDQGMSWTKYEHNPIINLNNSNFRDPKVFWYPGTKSWIMATVLAEAQSVLFFASKNLKNWTLLSDFTPAHETEGVQMECPDLFSLKEPESDSSKQTKWVLKFDITGDPAAMTRSGAQYVIGNFNGTHFLADGHPQWLDSGMDFYASNTWNNRYRHDGRRIIIGWVSNWYYSREVPTSPFRGIQSLPRSLSLVRHDGELRLAQQPIAELQGLRGWPISFDPKPMKTIEGYVVNFHTNHSRSMEIMLNVTVVSKQQLQEFGLKLMKGPGQELVMGWRAEDQSFFVNRKSSGTVDFSPHFPVENSTRVALPNDSLILAHVFLDWSTVEVFVNGGLATFTELFFPDIKKDGMEFYWIGARDAITYHLSGYEMESILNSSNNQVH